MYELIPLLFLMVFVIGTGLLFYAVLRRLEVARFALQVAKENLDDILDAGREDEADDYDQDELLEELVRLQGLAGRARKDVIIALGAVR